jgi:thiamine-monophosphate kinase
MTAESSFIARMRAIATDPGARGLDDDAAVLDGLVLTHDVIVEGVHFRPDDPPEDVAWKLAAVNASDLAAKGAVPVGCLLGFALGDADWDARFANGLRAALATLAMPLLGGDTVRGPRVLGLTAIGRAGPHIPSRAGARPGDVLWVTGRIGAAGIGLALLDQGQDGPEVAAYRRPQPRLAEGQALAPCVHAMMDVSDGLLIDAARMAEASGIAVTIDLDRVPTVGDSNAAIVAGDDYELLFALPGAQVPPVPATAIGGFEAGAGLRLFAGGRERPLPARLGWEHR